MSLTLKEKTKNSRNNFVSFTEYRNEKDKNKNRNGFHIYAVNIFKCVFFLSLTNES